MKKSKKKPNSVRQKGSYDYEKELRIPLIKRIWKKINATAFTLIPFCTIAAVIIAIVSLNKVEKARKDTFLPVIIIEEMSISVGETPTYGEYEIFNIEYRNQGHGMAMNVEISLTGYKNKQSIHCIAENEENHWGVHLDTDDIYNKKITSPIFLTIKYYDIFNRQIRTLYKGRQEEMGNGCYRLYVDKNSMKLELP